MANNNMTAVEWLIEQLQAPCRGIPSHIVEQAKQMEMEHIMDSFKEGVYEGVLTDINYMKCDEDAEYYYHKRYGKETKWR